MFEIFAAQPEGAADRMDVLKEVIQAQVAKWETPAEVTPEDELLELQEAEPEVAKPGRVARAMACIRKVTAFAKAKFGDAADRAFTLVLAMLMLEGGKAIVRLLV